MEESTDEFLSRLEATKALAREAPEEKGVDCSLERITELVLRYHEYHRFFPGDLVQWKPGLKNRKLPQAGEPMVVLRMLKQPARGVGAGSGSAYFNERLDLVGTSVHPSDGELCFYHYDSGRFEPYTPNE
jgi:hypothetical protein